MLHENKRNIYYFESASMRELYKDMEKWQNVNHKRFLSLDIHKDGDMFCCIAFSNPQEVVITNDYNYPHEKESARVEYGCLFVKPNN